MWTFISVFWKNHISKLTLLLVRNTWNVGRKSETVYKATAACLCLTDFVKATHTFLVVAKGATVVWVLFMLWDRARNKNEYTEEGLLSLYFPSLLHGCSSVQVLSGHEHGGKIWIFSHPMYVIYIGPQALQSVNQCKLTILVIIHQGLFSLNCKRTFHIANMHDIMFIKFREQTTLRFGQGSL